MNIRIITIKTTAFDEENFYLLTSLTDSEIKSVLEPIVKAERSGGAYYDNDDLINAMASAYPKAVVEMYDNFEVLSI